MLQVDHDAAVLVDLEHAYTSFDTFKTKYARMTEDEDDNFVDGYFPSASGCEWTLPDDVDLSPRAPPQRLPPVSEHFAQQNLSISLNKTEHFAHPF